MLLLQPFNSFLDTLPVHWPALVPTPLPLQALAGALALPSSRTRPQHRLPLKHCGALCCTARSWISSLLLRWGSLTPQVACSPRYAPSCGWVLAAGRRQAGKPVCPVHVASFMERALWHWPVSHRHCMPAPSLHPQAAAAQDESPRIAARHLPPGFPQPAAPMAAEEARKPVGRTLPFPLPVPVASITAASLQPLLSERQPTVPFESAAAQLPAAEGNVGMIAPVAADAAEAAEAVPAQLPDVRSPMHHLLVVPHGPGAAGSGAR